MSRPTVLATVSAVVLASAGVLQACGSRMPEVLELRAGPETVIYGYYSADMVPVIRIASGQELLIDTALASSPRLLERAGLESARVEKSLRRIAEEMPVGHPRRGKGGHILTGPVFVDGATEGDTLKVEILAITPLIDYALNFCGGVTPDACDGAPRATIVPLDLARALAIVAPGTQVPLRPFFGNIGVAPPSAAGRINSNVPGRHGGDMDNRELTQGTTLFLPVFVPGALFVVGDGHAAQGDGEVNQSALETSLRGRFRLTVVKGARRDWPSAETATHLISIGVDQDLHKATQIAVDSMIRILSVERRQTELAAYQVVSVASRIAVTQVVAGIPGVHIMIPKRALEVGR